LFLIGGGGFLFETGVLMFVTEGVISFYYYFLALKIGGLGTEVLSLVGTFGF
jgi:hypothetical protein